MRHGCRRVRFFKHGRLGKRMQHGCSETKHARFGLFKQSFVNTGYTGSKIKTSRFASVARMRRELAQRRC